MTQNGIRSFSEVCRMLLSTGEVLCNAQACLSLGIVGSLFSFLQFISSTLCGAASDRYGRKPVLLVSMVNEISTLLILLERLHLDRDLPFLCHLVRVVQSNGVHDGTCDWRTFQGECGHRSGHRIRYHHWDWTKSSDGKRECEKNLSGRKRPSRTASFVSIMW